MFQSILKNSIKIVKLSSKFHSVPVQTFDKLSRGHFAPSWRPELSRCICTGNTLFCEAENEEEKETETPINPLLDRSRVISPEESIRYMKSKAYQTTYGDKPVWEIYRRNFKGHYVPRQTRKTCIRHNMIVVGSPCPICRDEYLVLHYTNVDLLKQFINPHTGTFYDLRRIHICQKKLLQLQVAVEKAKYHGLITFNVPQRVYNYEEFYPNLKKYEKNA